MTTIAYESAINASRTCLLYNCNARCVFQNNYIKNTAFCTMITCSALQFKSLRTILIHQKNCSSWATESNEIQACVVQICYCKPWRNIRKLSPLQKDPCMTTAGVLKNILKESRQHKATQMATEHANLTSRNLCIVQSGARFAILNTSSK